MYMSMARVPKVTVTVLPVVVVAYMAFGEVAEVPGVFTNFRTCISRRSGVLGRTCASHRWTDGFESQAQTSSTLGTLVFLPPRFCANWCNVRHAREGVPNLHDGTILHVPAARA